MNKKKTLSVFVILFIVLAIVSISGCTDTTTQTRTQTQESTSPQADISNPAKVGEAVTVRMESGGETKTVEVSVVDYIRGTKANKMIKDANMFNDDPKPGYEYLLVKVKIKYISGEKTLSVNPLYFRVVINGAMHDYETVVLPDETPELELADLISGGKTEGWLAFMVPKDQKVLVAYTDIWGEPLAYIEIPAS